MPFIWDDLDYMMIDETEKYDRSRFVIARKLFVTPSTFTHKVSDFICVIEMLRLLFKFNTCFTLFSGGD